MYADWLNQAAHLLRYFGAFALLMFVFPRLIFRFASGEWGERAMSRFVMMTLLLIVLGYVLVAFKLFELMAIIPLLCLCAARRFRLSTFSVLRLFDWLEGKYDPRPDVYRCIKRKVRQFHAELARRFAHWPELGESLLLISVFAVSAYMRFYDALVHAAPAMSDGYVTLAWIKYIDDRILFHDGIYPQGFHIWMDYLAKFSFSDPLYILKYTGPLNMMLVMAGMYITVSRWTDNRLAGMAALIVFGLLSNVISGGDYVRQAATNSQEFGFVFVFPTVYLLHRWLRDRERWALAAGIAGMAVTGLVHSLAYVFLGIGVAALLIIYIPLTCYERLRPIWPVVLGGIGSVLLSAAPLGLGFLLGAKVHAASEDFATSRNSLSYLPDLGYVDIVFLLAIGIVFFKLVVAFRRIREHTGLLTAAVYGALTFVIHYFGNLWTFPGSEVITARSADLWALIVPVCVGSAAGVLFCRLRRLPFGRIAEISVAVGGFAVILAANPPSPIIPYKMEWDAGVEQYLAISQAFLPKTWMIVSPAREGYAVVAGKGVHMDTAQFLDSYDPAKWPLTQYGSSESDGQIPPHVFVYEQKNVFAVSKSNAIYPLMQPEYEARRKQTVRLEQWFNEQRKVNPHVRIWYEDENLKIYYLEQPISKADVAGQIWGEGGATP
ncbi:MAG TPA: hypothetical protein VF260_00990 [Bacilli bacterium]